MVLSSFPIRSVGKPASDGMRILLLFGSFQKKASICSVYRINRTQITEFREKELTSFFSNSINPKGDEPHVLCRI